MKLLFSYILSSLIVGAGFHFGAVQYSRINKSFVVEMYHVKDYVFFFLLWIFLGLVIGIVLEIIGRKRITGFVQFLICFLAATIFIFWYMKGLNSSYEGLYLWYTIAGFATGISIYLISQLLFLLFRRDSQS